jgi:hypothetical protein
MFSRNGRESNIIMNFNADLRNIKWKKSQKAKDVESNIMWFLLHAIDMEKKKKNS